MWQLLLIIEFLPTWFWIFLMSLAISGILLTYFIRTIPYKSWIIVGSIAALLLSTWALGAASNEDKWQARVKELEEKVAKAEAESKKENTVIQERIIYKDKIIREKGKTQIEYIDRVIKEKEEVKVFIEKCPIPQIIIDEHNKAARGFADEINKAARGEQK